MPEAAYVATVPKAPRRGSRADPRHRRSADLVLHPRRGGARGRRRLVSTSFPGETLAIVGESGCGKSVTALSILRLIPSPPGRIVSGAIRFAGRDLLGLSEAEMRQVRGNEISMIFQEPMTSLNPVLTIGRQIAETLTLHQGLDHKAALDRAVDMLRLVHIPEAQRRRIPNTRTSCRAACGSGS